MSKKSIALDTEFIADTMAIDAVMSKEKYTGKSGAHMGFIVQESGRRKFFIGGRTDLAGVCLSEVLANVVSMTPGVDESYIDTVAEVAKAMLKDLKTESERAPQ